MIRSAEAGRWSAAYKTIHAIVLSESGARKIMRIEIRSALGSVMRHNNRGASVSFLVLEPFHLKANQDDPRH